MLRLAGFKLLFYSNEGNRREPAHVHDRYGRDEAKFWLKPSVIMAYNDGLSARISAGRGNGLRTIGMTSKAFGMNISPTALRFGEDCLWADLADGRTIGVPLAWFPKLLHASPEQRENYELSRRGIHWDALDEDISVAGLLAGQGDLTRPTGVAA